MSDRKKAIGAAADHDTHEGAGIFGNCEVTTCRICDDVPADGPVDHVDDKHHRNCQHMGSREGAPGGIAIAAAKLAGKDACHAVRDERLQGDEQHQARENQGNGRECASPDIGAEEIGVHHGEQAVDGGDQDDRQRRAGKNGRQRAGQKGIGFRT